ncbi:Uncharacterized protein DAT39_005121, partial [Clarias magur]
MPAGKEVMVVIMRRLVESSRHVVLGLVLSGVAGVISSEGSRLQKEKPERTLDSLTKQAELVLERKY